MSDALAIERLTVRADRVCCDVRLALGAPRMTTPAIAHRLLAQLPTLADHTCVNELGEPFSRQMDHTSLPHMLEHIVIDLQARAADDADDSEQSAGAAALFVGTTMWTDEAAGAARVEVSFTDDLVALRAFRDAARILNAAVLP